MNILSVRYSVDRKDLYQIKTVIYEKNGVKEVSKEPYTDRAIQHIINVYNNFELLKKSSLHLIKPSINKNKIFFPFIEGENFASKLLKEVTKNNMSGFTEKLLWYKSVLLEEKQIEFYETEKFNNIFGINLHLLGSNCFQVSNIDLNFENLIIGNDSQLTVIDYEWVFDFPIPVDYVFYRVVTMFFKRYSKQLENFVSREEIFSILEIEPSLIPSYEEMENSFLNYVGGGWSIQRANYFKEVINKDKFITKTLSFEDSSDSKEYIQIFWDINNEFNEKDSAIVEIEEFNLFKIYEIELPNNHINRLRIDPSNYPSYISLQIFLHCDHQRINLTNKFNSSKGIIILNNIEEVLKMVCTENDPQLISEELFLSEGSKKLEIKFAIKNKDVKVWKELADVIEKQKVTMIDLNNINNNLQKKVNSQEYELEHNREDLKSKVKLLASKEEELGRLETIYQGMISTKGWKILERIRNLKKLNK